MLFQYAQLARDAIRLVQIHPSSSPADIHLTLSHQSRYFERPVKYTAIWYSHTASGDIRKTLTLNGRTRSVPLEAWNALSAICQYHNRENQYWIDAVCVNQQDDHEKRAHLQQSERIFSSADKVLLWLGMGDEAIAETFSAVEEHAASDSEQVAAAQSLAESATFVEILRRPELQQESAMVLSGRFEFQLKALQGFLQRNGRQNHGSL